MEVPSCSIHPQESKSGNPLDPSHWKSPYWGRICKTDAFGSLVWGILCGGGGLFCCGFKKRLVSRAGRFPLGFSEKRAFCGSNRCYLEVAKGAKEPRLLHQPRLPAARHVVHLLTLRVEACENVRRSRGASGVGLHNMWSFYQQKLSVLFMETGRVFLSTGVLFLLVG